MLIPNWPAPSNIKTLVLNKHDANINTSSNNNLLDKKIFWLNQVHENKYIDINIDFLNKLSGTKYSTLQNHITNNLTLEYKNSLPKYDASFTNLKNIACVVKTADCLPILITNTSGTWVSAIHAGWRGLFSSIIENTVNQYNSIYNTISDLIIWIGPAICGQHFIIDNDLRDKFIAQNNLDNSAFTKHKDYNKNKKWHADLYKLALNRLNLINFNKNSIYINNSCTYCNKNLFYSYRRDGARTGRQASLIWID